MENKIIETADSITQESKTEKVTLKDIDKNKEDELVDMVMSKILEIK